MSAEAMSAEDYFWYVLNEDGTYFSVESARLIRLDREGQEALEGGAELEEIEYPRKDWWSLDDVLAVTDAYPLPD